jgi:hypothetical protein
MLGAFDTGPGYYKLDGYYAPHASHNQECKSTGFEPPSLTCEEPTVVAVDISLKFLPGVEWDSRRTVVAARRALKSGRSDEAELLVSSCRSQR